MIAALRPTAENWRVVGGDLVVAVVESLQQAGVGEEVAVAEGLVLLGAYPPGQPAKHLQHRKVSQS